jgi:hypothetical protein
MVTHYVFLACPGSRQTFDPVIYFYARLGSVLCLLGRLLLFLFLFFIYFRRALHAANRRTTNMAVQPAPDKTRPYGVGPRAPFARM